MTLQLHDWHEVCHHQSLLVQLRANGGASDRFNKDVCCSFMEHKQKYQV